MIRVPAAMNKIDFFSIVFSMKYYYQIEGTKRNNIGDVLQGMAAKAFLPPESSVADREALADIDQPEPSFLIANGWYMHSFDKFPPAENITPLYVSVHIADSRLLANRDVRDHFKRYSPIGCRDIKTLHLFLGWGIPAYYSSCLTTTTRPRGIVDHSIDGEILLVDNVDHPVPAAVKQKLEKLLGKPLKNISHDPPCTESGFMEYVTQAESHMNELLTQYCKASMVITTKIHCALPCLGMGVKVIVIHPHPKERRLMPLAEFINIMSYDEILAAATIKVPEVRKRIFNRRRNFLSKLTNESVKLGYNALSKPRTLEFKMLRLKSVLLAKVCRTGLLIACRLGVAADRINLIYGVGRS